MCRSSAHGRPAPTRCGSSPPDPHRVFLFERLHHEPVSDRGRDRIARQRVDYRQCCPGHDALSTADWRGNGALSAWQSTISLKSPTATVEIRPLPVEDGRAAFSIAIFNHDGRPANLGMENITAVVNGIPTAVPTYAQLAEAAERKPRSTSPDKPARPCPFPPPPRMGASPA